MITTQLNNYKTSAKEILSFLLFESSKRKSNNKSASTILPKPSKFLSEEEFKMSHEQKRAWHKAAVAECKLRLNEPKVLEIITFSTNPITGIGDPSIGHIREQYETKGWGKIGYNTVREVIQRIKLKGAIQTEFRSNDSSIFRLVGYEYKPETQNKLESGSPESVYDLNLDLNLRDCTKETYYSEFVSVFANSDSKSQFKTDILKIGSKYADEKLLKGNLRNKEIERICIAWLLTSEQIEYVKQQMKSKSIDNDAEYLIGLCRGLTKEGWTMTTRDDLGYTKPVLIAENGKIKPPKPAKPVTPSVDFKKRQEIFTWAESKAREKARELGKARDGSDYERARLFDEWFGREVQYFEKQAYLKIHNREVGNEQSKS